MPIPSYSVLKGDPTAGQVVSGRSPHYQITVQAEMPGVSKEGLNVQADRNNLVIEGRIGLTMPPGMAALYADLQTTKYRRTFVLSGELHTEHIAATLKDGLLTVRIPKRVEFRTRKIKVEVP